MEKIQHLKSRIFPRILPLTLMLIGCTLIGLGAQRAVVAIILAPTASTIATIEDRKPVDGPDLDQLISTQRRALEILDDQRGWSNLGMAYALKAAQLPSDSQERRMLFTEAQISLQHSILAGPANPHAWLRLAETQALRDEKVEQALRYMDLSMMTGPNEPDLYLSRITIGITYWPYLVADERAALFKEMRQSFHYDGWPFVNLVVSLNAVNIARAALIVHREDFAKFEKMIPH